MPSRDTPYSTWYMALRIAGLSYTEAQEATGASVGGTSCEKYRKAQEELPHDPFERKQELRESVQQVEDEIAQLKDRISELRDARRNYLIRLEIHRVLKRVSREGFPDWMDLPEDFEPDFSEYFQS